MGDRRPLLSVGGPQTLCLPPVQSTFKDPAEGSAGGSRSSPSRAPLASEAVVYPLVFSCSGDSEKPSQDPGSSASIDFPLPSCKRKPPTSHSLAFFRQRSQEAGLSQRAADFAASSLRPSTRVTYDSRLAGFYDWCDMSSSDPSSAAVGCVSGFSLALVDKYLYFATIRDYRSAIASSHKGFPDGTTGFNSLYISKL